MKIKITTSCATAERSFVRDDEPIVDDVLGDDLIRAGYAELLDPDAQPPEPAPEPEPEPEPEAKTTKKKAAK